MKTHTSVHRVIVFSVWVWCALIVLAPFLSGSEGLAKLAGGGLYKFFGEICHQNNARTIHWGGGPLAVCARCTGIYGGFAVGILLFSVRNKWTGAMSHRRTIVVGALPMLVEVVAEIARLTEAGNAIRCSTGALFGLSLSAVLVALLVEATETLAQKTLLRFHHVKGPTPA